jgi:probable rRNA maturation factor
MILVEADASGEWDSSADWLAVANRAVDAAVRHSMCAGLIEAAMPVEISVRFTSDEEVRDLNQSYRGKNKATNVLSFPMVEPELIDAIVVGGEGELLLGDIVLARGVCFAEAAEKGISPEQHATHLVVHGTLHLLGYDHETGDEDADAMEAVERAALASLHISDPYLLTEENA